MKCPKCKNPIEDTATICEWCGFQIQKIEEKIHYSNFKPEARRAENTELLKPKEQKFWSVGCFIPIIILLVFILLFINGVI